MPRRNSLQASMYEREAGTACEKGLFLVLFIYHLLCSVICFVCSCLLDSPLLSNFLSGQ